MDRDTTLTAAAASAPTDGHAPNSAADPGKQRLRLVRLSAAEIEAAHDGRTGLVLDEARIARLLGDREMADAIEAQRSNGLFDTKPVVSRQAIAFSLIIWATIIGLAVLI